MHQTVTWKNDMHIWRHHLYSWNKNKNEHNYFNLEFGANQGSCGFRGHYSARWPSVQVRHVVTGFAAQVRGGGVCVVRKDDRCALFLSRLFNCTFPDVYCSLFTQVHLSAQPEAYNPGPGYKTGGNINKNLFFDKDQTHLYITTEKKVRGWSHLSYAVHSGPLLIDGSATGNTTVLDTYGFSSCWWWSICFYIWNWK